MNLLNMTLYWHNIKEKYMDRELTNYDLCKILARNLRLYALIDQFKKIFELIKKIEVSDFISSDLINCNCFTK